MDKKTYTAAAAVKDADEGTVQAEFATLNVVDLDGDVTLPGAFGKQAVKLAAWGHDWGSLPVGKGGISEQEEKAVFDGQFFLDTNAGLDHFRTVRNLGELQEWSYGFEVQKAVRQGEDGFDDLLDASGLEVSEASKVWRFLKKMKVFEVSPVMRGAGVDTRTTAIKGDKSAIGAHGTATSDGPWDGPANAARISAEATAATLRRAYAWVDPEGDPATKAAYKFIHHEVSGEGAIGAANLAAASTGIGVLNGGRGGTTIPEADRAGVWRHLARHLRDGDREPPELREKELGEEAPWRDFVLSEHADFVIEEARAFLERCQSVTDGLDEEGRLLSASKRDRLHHLGKALESVRDEITALLKRTEHPTPERLLGLLEEARRTEERIQRLGS